ncbi:MAG: hypothetical protein LAT51_10660 [Flavobacteriaceae bacterium]|nr:hypothetical protein [Flavobacteriaceae bacterium]
MKKSNKSKTSIAYGVFVGLFYSSSMSAWDWWKDDFEWWMFFFRFFLFGIFMSLFYFLYLSYKSK